MNDGVNIFISGQTGSGKSYLVKSRLADQPRVMVYLTKREDRGYPGVTFDALAGERPAFLTWWRHCAASTRLKRFRIVYRPRDAYDFTEFDGICKLVYQLGDLHFVCEELSTYVSPAVFRRTDYGLAFKTLLQAGRTRGVTTWLVNQRPSGVPIECKSEAREAFIFKSCEPIDLDYIKTKFGIEASLKLMQLQPFEYIHWTETGTMEVGKA
jgi:hypothetical protein